MKGCASPLDAGQAYAAELSFDEGWRTVASFLAFPETVKHRTCEAVFMKNTTVSVEEPPRSGTPGGA